MKVHNKLFQQTAKDIETSTLLLLEQQAPYFLAVSAIQK